MLQYMPRNEITLCGYQYFSKQCGDCMDKFSSALRGYDKKEVNAFIDKIITQVESMVKEIEEKDKKIEKLQKVAKKNQLVAKKLSAKIEVLNNEIEMLNQKENFSKEYDRTMVDLAKSKSEAKKIMANAKAKGEKIVKQAEENADAITQECLLNAKKKEMELNTLKSEIDKLKQMKETLYYGS